DLSSDGRPIFNGLSSPELVEILMSIYEDILIIPSHAWTTWWSIFGAFSGFDSVEECYKDQTKHVYAIETGLSSDPPMNWRLSKLDKFCLMSNSDAHSPWIWRLGREFNMFDIKKLSYHEIIDAVKKRDKKRFLFTVEVSPEYGKYHYTGHRNCNVSLHPKDAIKLNNKCPKCGKKLTIGVLQRVEELADRPEGFILKDAIPYKSLLPLYEIISYVMGIDQLYSKRVMEEQDKLIAKFGNESNVLFNAKKDELTKVTHAKIADAIIKTREGRVDFIAGYDGVYGKPIFDTFEDTSMEKREFHEHKEARSLDDFM
ncbi:MAG: DNA helicase UvrD, partial [archaeon]|nr:DNA helicase UvrD [archaeon]